MRPRFLLDEHLDHAIREALHALDPSIDVVRVGDPYAAPLGTFDPEILLWCESERRILVTNNRRSMPGHVADHFKAGHHHWGIFTTRERKPTIGRIVEELYLVWGASEAEEYIDTQQWIPFTE